MNQSWKNGKKSSFGTILAQIWSPKDFSWILPLLDVTHCCKLSLYAISRKTNERKLRKWQKTSFRADFGSFDPNVAPPPLPKLFREFYLYYMLNIVARYHCMQFQRKLMN